MPLWLAILAGVGPCFVWMWLLHRHDDNEAEPWWLVLFAMGLGGLSTCGVLWTDEWLEHLVGDGGALAYTFLVTALGEEGWKFVALVPLLLHAELDEPLDGAIYGVAVGLGFAGVENVYYANHGGDVVLLLQRAFTATLVHAVCTGSLGFCWGMARLHGVRGARALWPVLGVLIAIVLHTFYDHWLGRDRGHMLLSLLVVLPIGLVLLALKVRWARARSREYHPAE